MSLSEQFKMKIPLMNLRFHFCSLAYFATQEIQLSPADIASAHNLNSFYIWRMDWEDPLDTYAIRNTADSKSFTYTAAFACYYGALKGLNSFPVALTHIYIF